MARYKGNDDTQTARIPVSLDNQLLPGTVEFAIQELVERCMDTFHIGSVRQLLLTYTIFCILSEWQTNPLFGSALRSMFCVRFPRMRARRQDFNSEGFSKDCPSLTGSRWLLTLDKHSARIHVSLGNAWKSRFTIAFSP